MDTQTQPHGDTTAPPITRQEHDRRWLAGLCLRCPPEGPVRRWTELVKSVANASEPVCADCAAAARVVDLR